MDTILLLGEPTSKRSIYFTKAAAAQGKRVILRPLFSVVESDLANSAVKIDPVSYHSSDIARLEESVQGYSEKLLAIASGRATFLNTPRDIIRALDKRQTKAVLREAGIPVTPELVLETIQRESLFAAMDARRPYGVFIKPNHGSGAAGIIAYRRQYSTGRGVAYTTLAKGKGTYHNAKKIYRVDDPSEVAALLDFAMKKHPIVEVWLPKARHNGYSYDLRAVVQFGSVDYLVARGSEKMITNLHLNNHPIDLAELDLTEYVLEQVKDTAIRAVQALSPTLQVAGVDLLLTPDKRLYVIEINAQGDLIHQDIYGENSIYRKQVEGMLRM